MPLDPDVRLLLEDVAALGQRPLPESSPEQARAAYAEVSRLRRGGEHAPVPVGAVADDTVRGPAGQVPVRVYHPRNHRGKTPLIVFFHGGGWVVGDIDTHDVQARALCHGVGAVVVSVAYRLAPEHPFPAGLEDCYAATSWASTSASSLGAQTSRLVVAGDSSGGNLAAAVALLARERGGPGIAAQALVYPAVDARLGHPSLRENADGYEPGTQTMGWYHRQYLSDDRQATDPLVSPLLAADLRGLPAAVVATAQYDPLRDEGEAYADRLRQAGVPVESIRYAGLVHGFFGMGPRVPAARQAIDRTCAAVRRAVAVAADGSG